MNVRPTRLLVPTGGPSLDEAQLTALGEQFEVVMGEDADAHLKAGVSENDVVLHCGSTVAVELASIEAAGQGLVAFNVEDIERLNAFERVKWLEQLLIEAIGGLMHFDHFEIRLLNEKTRQLELVIAVGLKPLGIGEMIYARERDNGICGYVAASGHPYLCPDVQKDPRYTTGLDHAGSSLTVPMKLHGKVMGVLNIEAEQKAVFDESDLQSAELLARYIAISLHMLDLLVAERHTTRRVASETFREELEQPISQMEVILEELAGQSDLPAESSNRVAELTDLVGRARAAAKRCEAGPKSLLGAESTLREVVIHPDLQSRLVLVVDDDEEIRKGSQAVLEQSGAEVFLASDGQSAMGLMDELIATGRALDLLISDVRLPDLNGFEIFTASQERFNNLPVVLMTGFGYDPHHSIVRASQDGLQSILFKPFKGDQLVEEAVKALTIGGAGRGESGGN